MPLSVTYGSPHPRPRQPRAQAHPQQVCLEKYIPSLTPSMFPGSITGSILFST